MRGEQTGWLPLRALKWLAKRIDVDSVSFETVLQILANEKLEEALLVRIR